jgi:hypothetical protein
MRTGFGLRPRSQAKAALRSATDSLDRAAEGFSRSADSQDRTAATFEDAAELNGREDFRDYAVGIVGSQRTIAGSLSSCGGSDAAEVIQCCCAPTGARAWDLRITSRPIPLFGQDAQLICRAMKFGDSGMSSELVDGDKSWSLAINDDGASVARRLSQIFVCPSSACFIDH